jgi:type II secretory pathway pseudopilin PulG
MKDFIRRKKNRSGASLAEMLATVLIMSLVMLAVTSGIAASQRVYRQVRQKADAQTLMSTTINAIAGKLYYSYVWSYSSTPSEISDSRKGIGYEQTSVRPSVPRTTEKTGTVDWIFSEGEGYIRIGNMTGSNNSTETVTVQLGLYDPE